MIGAMPEEVKVGLLVMWPKRVLLWRLPLAWWGPSLSCSKRDFITQEDYFHD